MTRIEDMPLDEHEEKQVVHWKSHGALDAAERTAMDYRKRRYMDRFLQGETVRSSSRNCYSEGVVRYVRKDGGPLTSEDIRAIDMCRYGQGHAIQGKVGDLEVFHHWHCDSSD